MAITAKTKIIKKKKANKPRISPEAWKILKMTDCRPSWLRLRFLYHLQMPGINGQFQDHCSCFWKCFLLSMCHVDHCQCIKCMARHPKIPLDRVPHHPEHCKAGPRAGDATSHWNNDNSCIKELHGATKIFLDACKNLNYIIKYFHFLCLKSGWSQYFDKISMAWQIIKVTLIKRHVWPSLPMNMSKDDSWIKRGFNKQ